MIPIRESAGVTSFRGMTLTRFLVLAQRKQSAYRGGMSPHVLVRNVPADIHAVLVARAQAAGQSLQEYLLGLLTQVSSQPTMAEVVEKIRHTISSRPDIAISTEDVVSMIRAGREDNPAAERPR